MPKLRHYDNLNTARFITISCYRRQQLLSDPSRIKILLQELEVARQTHALKIYGYVIMPEHIHLVIHMPDGIQLGRIIGEIKSKSARKIFAKMREAGVAIAKTSITIKEEENSCSFWQKRCYDHNCRTHKTTIEKINYCHNNPVKRNLAKSASDWRWSSAAWYQGSKNVPLAIDNLEKE